MKKVLLFIACISIYLSSYSQKELWGMARTGGPNEDGSAGVIYKTDGSGNNQTIEHSFKTISASEPLKTNLIEASNGKLYGMTSQGGENNQGVIFQYDPITNTYKHKFHFVDKYDSTANGGKPCGSLIQASDGMLYGMTSNGGHSDVGVIFRFNPSTDVYTKMFEFNDYNTTFGNPTGSLVQASNGMLYGMANGGYPKKGGIFEFDPKTSVYTKKIEFSGDSSGYSPTGSLILASDGMLYGMTRYGGGPLNSGAIFQYNPNTSSFSMIHSFTNNEAPEGDLVQASDGMFYGMSGHGGANNSGVIFRFDPVTQTYTKLSDFPKVSQGNDRTQGNLIQASDGMLYGMTPYGGASNAGFIFNFSPTATPFSTYNTLYNFNVVDSSGCLPFGSLMQASDGKLYGMSKGGDGWSGDGVLFQYDILSSLYTQKIRFHVTKHGGFPYGSLMLASDGMLYGMTDRGGKMDAGVLFQMDPKTSVYTPKFSFGTDAAGGNRPGVAPEGSLIEASDGMLYGMTLAGGVIAEGVIFQYNFKTNTCTKKYDFNGGYNGDSSGSHPRGNLIQATDGKLYGISGHTIFQFDPVTSVYSVKYKSVEGDMSGSFIQAKDGKLYGMSFEDNGQKCGVLFQFDPVTSVYSKKINFTRDNNGGGPRGSLVEGKDGMLYGMTSYGGANFQGVIFQYNPSTSLYTKKYDFPTYTVTTGYAPDGTLMQAADGKLYGVAKGGVNKFGVLFQFDPVTNIYTKKLDFNGANGKISTSNNLIEIDITPKNSSGTISISACKNYTSPSGKYIWTKTGTYNDTIKNKAGFDSLMTINLTIKTRWVVTMNVKACNSYTSPSGKIWKLSGTYKDTIHTTAGCDSLMTINLTVGKTSSKTINIVACDKYISPSGKVLKTSGTFNDTIKNKSGCDSLIKINLTIKKSSYKTINVVACDKYVSPTGNVLRTSGKYKDTLQNAVHCDSIITINLTIKNSTYKTIYTSACNKYISPSGKVLTVSGKYKDTINNSRNCDSIITINLTIKKSSSKTINPIACMQYASPSGKHIWTKSGTYKDTIKNRAGCDSLLTINLTIKKSTSATFSVIACTKYVSPSKKHVWRTSGIYKDTIRNAAGCDSLLTIKLTVTTLITTVTKSGEMLTSNAMGTTYQWLDCRNNFAKIIGATSRSFKPSKTSTYAVALSDNGCKDTSVCTLVKVTCYSHFTTRYNSLKNSFILTADTSTIGFASTYNWDFGDGTKSTLATPPAHVYTNDSLYKACLKIKTASGEICNYCHMIGKDAQGNIVKSGELDLDEDQIETSSIISSENNVVIFPNPTSGEAEIMLNQTVNNASIKVVNITGQKVLEKSNVSGNRVSIDISNQTQGIYFIEILSDGNVWRGKLVKE